VFARFEKVDIEIGEKAKYSYLWHSVQLFIYMRANLRNFVESFNDLPVNFKLFNFFIKKSGYSKNGTLFETTTIETTIKLYT